MDKIIKLSSRVEEPIKEQPKPQGPAASTRSKTSGEGKEKSFLDKTKEKLKDFKNMGVVSGGHPPADVHSRFSVNDCVVIQTAQGVPVRGWVRCVGPVKLSKSAGGITVSTVGIETVSC